jgi:2-dehydro-3-deoxyphosphogluconate aldolase/(4S)-4-hydroxy-2-oxoglutarate aldolase
MLGAYTPTECQLAYEAGADFVKLFPADTLGPSFVRAVRAPLPYLRLVPTGGVDLTNAADFLEAGCVALGVGSSLVSSELLKTQNWSELTRRASGTDFVGKGGRWAGNSREPGRSWMPAGRRKGMAGRPGR